MKRTVKKTGRGILALLLAVLMLLGCYIALPVSAADTEVDWSLNFGNMTSVTDNKKSTEYSLTNSGFSFVMRDGAKVLNTTRGYYRVNDTNNVLPKKANVFVDADFNFASLPASDADTYSLAVITFVFNNTYTRSVRINSRGELYTDSACTGAIRGEDGNVVKLPAGKWFNLSLCYQTSDGSSELRIDGEKVATFALPSVVGEITTSFVRFFDTRSSYNVAIKNIHIYSDSSYEIGKIESADMVSFQTTPVSGGKFDLRAIAGVNSLDYRSVGFRVTKLSKSGDVLESKDFAAASTSTAYEAVRAGDTLYSVKDSFGYNYAALCTVTSLDLGNYELVIRPYTVSAEGEKVYGKAMTLSFDGTTNGGYPVVGVVGDQAIETLATVAEDTYIGGMNGQSTTPGPHGSELILDVKNNANRFSDATTRQTFLKFNLDAAAIAKIKANPVISLQITVKSASVDSTEVDAGGILARLSSVTTDWDEDTLVKAASESAYGKQKITDFRYGSSGTVSIDITSYIKGAVNGGATSVAFCIQNVDSDGNHNNRECTFYSKEYNGGSNAARLVSGASLLDHELNLKKAGNLGYEPWAYAEQLVDKWFRNGGDRDRLYSFDGGDLGIAAVNNNSSNASTGYTVYNPYKSQSSGSYGANYAYVRTLATLPGYTEAKGEKLSTFDEYHGITNLGVKGNATGFFHTETLDGKTYIIDPLGYPFISTGVNTVNTGATQHQKDAALKKYGSDANFYSSVAAELWDTFGITTVTGWTADNDDIASIVSCGGIGTYMGQLGLSVSKGGSSAYMYNNTMNVFDPDFVTVVEAKSQGIAAIYKDKANVLGYTSDNEIPGGDDILLRYLTLDPSVPVNAFSYATAWTWLGKAVGKVNPTMADATGALSREFLAFVYNRYFEVVVSAIKKYDPNHMYLGTRAHTQTKDKEGFLRALRAWGDVMTTNLYGAQNYQGNINTIAAIKKYFGKPFIVTEFFARAEDAVDMNGYKLGNQNGSAGWVVADQQARANSFESYVLLLLESDLCAGWTWYRFRDNDQTIYVDGSGNYYFALQFSSDSMKPTVYENVSTHATYTAAQLGDLLVFYQGETDVSNLGSNKGIYDNHMEPYTVLASSMRKITDNLSELLKFFKK